MIFSEIRPDYDIVIAGGGVTGAGLFHLAVKKGYSVLLLDAQDFAWGTSSRSSKMVHGGLRYLKQGKFLLTKSSVRERERLLKTYSGLVTPLDFIMPVFRHYGPSKSAMKFGLSLYSLMAGKRQHKTFSKKETIQLIPQVKKDTLISAVGFKDAQVDDARLVLRLLADAASLGGHALNYTKVETVVRDIKGKVSAIRITDQESGETKEIKTKVLINATGPFAEKLHPSPQKDFHIRPLRGSHLAFPKSLFPVDRVVSFIHPKDSRPVFIFPWENVVILGTTDVDHKKNINMEPKVEFEEAVYLLEGLYHILPGLKISLDDCISSFAGVRPVLSKKKKAASKESREHVVWKEKGLITITGGKLTTFNLLARDALKAASSFLPKKKLKAVNQDLVNTTAKGIDENKIDSYKRLKARYGNTANQIIESYDGSLFVPVEKTTTLWVELCHAAEHENVRHLSDLLLRRVRIGLLLKQGGAHILDQVETIVGPYLNWDSNKWEMEKQTYIALWQNHYSVPKARPKN